MNQSLSATITRLRKEWGLTQEQLGQLVGVSAQAVSKWEKGGAPDVELLPVLADRLGVPIDALFGRAEPSTADMTTQFQQWLLSMPIEKRFSALFEMLAVSSPYLGSNLMGSGIIPAISVQSTCYIDNVIPTPSTSLPTYWIRAYVTTEEGLALGVLAQDFPLFLLLPEPVKGYQSNLPDPERCRKLFAALALPFRLPEILWSVIKDVAAVTTTISFISLGVSLDLGETRANRRPLAYGILLRMVLVPLIFLPLSVLLGFRGPTLCALMVLFAAPTAVASYPMAVAMGADGQLAGQLVCLTTVLSVFTMFCFTFLFQSLGLL